MGYSIRQARVGVGKTQEEMAAAVGLQPQTYRKYEKNPQKTPYWLAKAIANTAGIALTELDLDRA